MARPVPSADRPVHEAERTKASVAANGAPPNGLVRMALKRTSAHGTLPADMDPLTDMRCSGS